MRKILDTITRKAQTNGFTSIELIIVIIVMSVLAGALIIKNPFSISDYSSIAADQLVADIQYIQMRAMGLGGRQSIIFQNNSNTYCICNTSVCTYDTCDSTGEVKKLPGNVRVSATSISTVPGYNTLVTYNTLGEPVYGSCIIRLSNIKDVIVNSITGKVE